MSDGGRDGGRPNRFIDWIAYYISSARGVSIVSAVAAILTIVVGFISFYTFDVQPSTTAPPDDTLADLGSRVRDNEEMLQELEVALSEILSSELPTEQQVARTLRSLQQSVEEVSTTQDQLSEALLSTPEKALALPLLAGEVENLQEQLVQTRESLVQADRSQMDLFRWIIVVVVVGLLGTAITSFRQNKEK